ncbi:MAG: hypothetical protein ACP5E9_10870 [Candidatus Methanospirareceae archaeon]
MTITDAASVASINWMAAKRIDKKYLSRLVTGLEDLNPKKPGIYEIAYEKGHRYLTVVRDLDIGRVDHLVGALYACPTTRSRAEHGQTRERRA